MQGFEINQNWHPRALSALVTLAWHGFPIQDIRTKLANLVEPVIRYCNLLH